MDLPSPFHTLSWRPIARGFSGAPVFAGSDHAESLFVMKAWPKGVVRRRIELVHAFRRHIEADVPFASKLASGVFEADGLYWDISTWRPGAAPESLTQQQADAAAIAIGRLHRSAASTRSVSDTIPQRVRTVNAAIRMSRLDFPQIDPISAETHETILIHGDLHLAHIFFNQDSVTGLIDFTSVKRDHPAVDYARYFGRDVSSLQHYHDAGGSRSVTPDLVRYLHRAILLGAAAFWQKRFDDGVIPEAQRLQASLRFRTVLSQIDEIGRQVRM